MKKLFALSVITLLFLPGCKKENKSTTELLTGNGRKDWKRYQYQQNNDAPHSLNSCFTDDVWRFYSDGDLEVDISGTDCGGFGIAGPVIYGTWKFNTAQDSISWTYNSTLETSAFKINKLDDAELIVYQRVDSNGQTETPQSTIDMQNYFIKR